MAPPGGRHGGGYNDIPENDGSDGDYSDGDGGNPFAAPTTSAPRRTTAAIRAGGALDDGNGHRHANDRGAYMYDDDDLDDLDDFEGQASASSSSRRRNRRSGHRRMDVQTLGSRQGRGGNDVSGAMTKCWLYCGLTMLAVMGVLLGILKESRIEKHMAAPGGGGIGVEGYARPQQDSNDGNDDDDDDYGRHWHDEQQEKVANAASPLSGSAPPPGSTGGSGGHAAVVPMKPAKKVPHHRDPAATFRSHDPFHLTDTSWYGPVFSPPPFPAYSNAHAADDGNDEEDSSSLAGYGYFQSPSIHNNTLVFTSEGDLYLTQIPSSTAATIDNKDDGPLAPLPSVKLTTTVGNVLTPHINPAYPYLVAYTGTYTGTREAYLLDLRPSSARGFGPAGPAMRLSYFDGVYGVERIVGWDDDGTSLVVATMHDEVGIENMRLYKIGIVQNGKETTKKKRRGLSSHHHGSPITVSSVDAIPLHQAIDGVTTKSVDGESKCIFFTRFKQSSSTFRYVGGTAEHLWAWCEGKDRAVALTADYRGTSKSPGIYTIGTGGGGGDDNDTTPYLLYISDRFEAEDGSWIPGTLNLWAVPLPSQDELYSNADSGADAKADYIPKKLRRPFPLTSVNCDYNGMSLMEYSIDEVTGNIILRIGADLHLVERKEVVDLLKRGGKRRRLDDDVESDGDKEGAEKSIEAESVAKKETKKKKRNKVNEGADQSVASAAIPKAAKDKSVSSHLGSKRLPISIMSDLQNLHERLLPITHPTYAKLVNGIDAYKTPYGTMSALITIRGQAWINPVIPDLESFYEFEGGAMNLPPRRYRVVPGSTTGGMTRVMQALHVPQPEKFSRTSLIVATDPLSPTAELAFYLIETLADSTPAFSEIDDLPRPILGGHVNGGSVKDGGLGSIKDDGVVVSPCGRRIAWTDTDGRICAMALPDLGAYWSTNATELEAADPLTYTVLPQENENGEPLIGIGAELTWSPGGRYLAIEHAARNQFSIISIADLGEIGEVKEKTPSSSNDAPSSVDGEITSNNADWTINVGRIVQATPDRFNSGDVFWGRTAFDMAVENALGVPGSSKILPTATTLYYLTDRDVMLSDVSSPWGTRAPGPHFKKDKCVYALPLVTDKEDGVVEGEDEDEDDLNLIKKMFGGPYSGGGASELAMLRETVLEEIEAAKEEAEEAKEEKEGPDTTVSNLLSGDNSTATTNGTLSEADSAEAPVPSLYPTDVDISFGPKADASLSFARRAYRMSNIPKASYATIISQLKDDVALILMEDGENGPIVKVFSIDDFPSDGVDPMPVDIPGMEVISAGLSTSRHHLWFIYKLPSKYRTKIIGNDAGSVVSMLIKDDAFTKNIVDNVQWALSIWPSLEYQQMYADAWRLLRDYYYDAGMTDINWKEVYERYLPLVGRAAKREELDDVLRQMASELSALHVFVYGGEYNSPLHEDVSLEMANEVSSLGATLRRSVEWAGYVVTSIPERDQDFALMDGKAIYSPLSEDTLRMSGQRGLEVGDVIIGVNGESVMNVPSIQMLLRGMAGKSVRLEVLRVKSGPSPLLARKRKRQLDAASDVGETKDKKDKGDDEATPEPLIAVPLSPSDAAHLRYTAWEWRTRNAVKDLSQKAGFTAGYIHLRDMSGGKAADAFVRGFYPDYDKQALIVDVRANHGGNIDSWLLDVLQKRAWMYWQGRATNITNGGLGWDEQFAFRGHVVVLINEKTSSDGEGFSRGISELGLGKLVGTRTWGGGIWLSSDNHLVDGGIASAPEIGTYNKKFGWGLGIENMGVEPDIWVDNDPHETYGGRDAQLEKAIEVLKDWLEEEPVVLPQSPGRHRDMSLRDEAKRCSARSK